MEEEIAKLKEKVASLTNKNQELLEQITEGESVREDLSMVVWQKQERIKSLQLAIDNYQEEKKKQADLLANLQLEIRGLQSKNSALEKQLEELYKILNQEPIKMTLKAQELAEKILSSFKKK